MEGGGEGARRRLQPVATSENEPSNSDAKSQDAGQQRGGVRLTLYVRSEARAWTVCRSIH